MQNFNILARFGRSAGLDDIEPNMVANLEDRLSCEKAQKVRAIYLLWKWLSSRVWLEIKGQLTDRAAKRSR